jgi:hypothetical protein
MVLEAPAFGTTARGLAANEKALTQFFTSFPDYDVVLQGHASNGDTLICWGTARMTMAGDRFGVVSNGEAADLPVFIQFAFQDGLIAGERFFLDLSALCAQSGVSTDAVRRKLFGGRGPNLSRQRRPHMTSDARVTATGEITTEHLFDMVVELNRRLNIGRGPFGQRVLFGAAGGSFEGPKVRGGVLPAGGDWALFRPDRAMTLDVRLTLRTHDDALVHMTYGGRWIIPPELRADIADPLTDTISTLLATTSAQLRSSKQELAVRVAQRHRLCGIGIPDQGGHRLQGRSGQVSAGSYRSSCPAVQSGT